MSMVINTNTSSLIAQQAQNATSKAMDTAMERLSTGKRINSAADDAAGLAMANRMESAVRGLTVAVRNAGDAQSLINTAESAHGEVESMLQRMREIAVQAASDSNSSSDRANLNKEVIQLKAEIDRIASQTSWGGQKVLDNTFAGKSFQVGMKSGETVNISVDGLKTSQLGAHTASSTAHIMEGTDNSNAETRTSTSIVIYGRDATETASFTAADSAKEVAAAVNLKSGTTGVSAEAKTHLYMDSFTAGTATFNLVGDATAAISATVTATDIRALIDAINQHTGATGVTASAYQGNNAQLLLTHDTGADIEINTYSNTNATKTVDAYAVNFAGTKLADTATLTAGAGNNDTIVSVGQVNFSATSSFTLDDAGTATTGYDADQSSSVSYVSTVSVTTKDNAASSLAVIDGALEKLLDQRSYLGAISNRLDYTMSNLTEIRTNISASKSRIEDADFAVETSNLTKAQILSQAATAMLAQANASKQSVLSLLQG
jgi:flagellin